MQEDLSNFYKEHNIEYSYDGIGNSSWSYKGITIAWYIDVEPYVTEVFCHWSVDKRNRYPRIEPVKKTNKKYYTPEGFSGKPWMDFEDYNEDIEKFKKALLTSIELLEPRIQILKGKITMVNKNRSKKLSNEECITRLSSSDFDRAFSKERNECKIKLDNGNVLPCKKLDNKYVIYDGNDIHLIHMNTTNNNYMLLSKNDVQELIKGVK
ncbi:MAG: hypothetical protein MJZ34_11155 [Paludibacteraceae bacterium]|nr:hypothetical protein [Paludibacteraceae bacterium]